MTEIETRFQAVLRSGEPITVVEISPPKGGDPAPLRSVAKRYQGKIHAISVSDNRHGICMSALAAGAVLVSEGIETIVHMVTRDRNRVALIADCLGAQALGLRNILFTSGTSVFRPAKNVYDMDSTQLIEAISNLGSNGSGAIGERFDGAGPFCLGAVAAPFADPAELQLMRLVKKVKAGAKFMITEPVYDLERFRAWWDRVTERSIQEQAAVIAGIRPLLDAGLAKEYAEGRPCPRVPGSLLDRLSSAGDQRAAGIEIAVETIKEISGLKGLRGFHISAEGDESAALEIIERAGLEVH